MSAGGCTRHWRSFPTKMHGKQELASMARYRQLLLKSGFDLLAQPTHISQLLRDSRSGIYQITTPGRWNKARRECVGSTRISSKLRVGAECGQPFSTLCASSIRGREIRPIRHRQLTITLRSVENNMVIAMCDDL